MKGLLLLFFCFAILQVVTVNGANILDNKKESAMISTGMKSVVKLLDTDQWIVIQNSNQIGNFIQNKLMPDTGALIKGTPEELVQRQLNAYNLRDIEAFLEPYAEDVEIFNFPGALQMKGKDSMRILYSKLFSQVPNLHCELKVRIIQGNTVIDKERVRFGDQFVEAVAIYQVENEKIKRVYFVE